MNARRNQIDLLKLTIYILKRIWLVVICAIIGFAGMYWYTTKNHVDTYTASGTMYIYNGNPNVVNYQYTNISDLNSAVQLLDTYTVVVKSSKVLDVAWGSKDNGANVQQCDYYGNACQQWELRKVGNSYAIISRNSGKALDVSGRSKADGANVLQWDYSGAANQLWTIEAVY